MKKIISTIVCCLFILCSCSNIESEEFIVNEDSVVKDQTLYNKDAGLQPSNMLDYSLNEAVVRLNVGLTAIEKQSIRDANNVISYEICSYCIDIDIEKWTFDLGEEGIDIETKIGAIDPDDPKPEGILRIDKQFYIEYPTYAPITYPVSLDTGYASKMVSNNSGVTIAVIDTGVGVNYPVFTNNTFLYNYNGPITDINSGWDFINHDDNTYDDNMFLHGTAVSSIISNSLESSSQNTSSVPHQILPIKVTNANGSGSYFSILCGFGFVLDKVDIINMSIGWYSQDVGSFDSILSDLIEEYEDHVLVVTSAGNYENNNDGLLNGDLEHFPSGYSKPNMLTIASSNANNTDIAIFSNYGSSTVHFFAPGDVSFYGQTMIGTSFSAPIVSAVAARSLFNSGMVFSPVDIVNDLNTNYSTTVNYTKPTVYSKRILP